MELLASYSDAVPSAMLRVTQIVFIQDFVFALSKSGAKVPGH